MQPQALRFDILLESFILIHPIFWLLVRYFQLSLKVKTVFQLFVLIGDFQEKSRGLPWWYNGWESACQCRVHRFDPWSGRSLHTEEQLSRSPTTTEFMCHNYRSLGA